MTPAKAPNLTQDWQPVPPAVHMARLPKIGAGGLPVSRETGIWARLIDWMTG